MTVLIFKTTFASWKNYNGKTMFFTELISLFNINASVEYLC